MSWGVYTFRVFRLKNLMKKDKRTFYGQIPIELGYNQGEERSSNLNENQFIKIFNKVREYGGLYIYRDDFRVLPYGRHNADFLNFEEAQELIRIFLKTEFDEKESQRRRIEKLDIDSKLNSR